MPYCAVPLCSNGSAKRNQKQKGIKLHRFPKALEESSQWWQAIHRDEVFTDVKDPRVCTAHFSEESLGPDRCPLPGVIPCLKIPVSHPSKNTSRVKTVSIATDSIAGASASPKSARKPSDGNDGQGMEPAAAAGAVKIGLFTEQQAKYLVTGVRPCPWDEDSILKALHYRCNTSRKTYEWLRSVGQPLPSINTLQSWLSEFRLEPDVCAPQIELLRRMMSSLSSDMQRQCVLMFDEMDVLSQTAYDHARDQVFGPHRHLQVIMVAGVFADWKLPVLFAFDRPVTTDLLLSTISEVEAAGANVVATVCDQGASNQGLWRALGVGHDGDVSFVNPADDSRRVWVLSDLPHGMKCLRNNILDRGLHTSGGGYISKELLKQVMMVDGTSDFKLMYKLNASRDLELSGMSRQKVRPAMQLLSGTTADCMRRHLQGKEEEARTIHVFNGMCDILNRINPRDPKELRRGYKGDPKQEEVLDAAVRELQEMRFGTVKHLYPFQKGLLVTIRSVRGLLQDMRELFGPDVFLLTRRLTQDRLEGFFGMVRGRSGSNSNPNPVDAMAIVRLLTLLFSLNSGANPVAGEKECLETDLPSESEQLSELREEATVAIPEDIEGDLASYACSTCTDEDLAEQDQSNSQGQRSGEEGGSSDVEAIFRELEEATPPAASALSLGSADLVTGTTATASAMTYVCGYVARKSGDRSLGCVSSQSESGPVEALWTRLRSEGGLTVPTGDFNDVFSQMEATFCAHHAFEPDQLSRKPHVIANFLSILESKFPTMPPSALKAFARVRTFIRMRVINDSRRAASLAKRAARKRKQAAL